MSAQNNNSSFSWNDERYSTNLRLQLVEEKIKLLELMIKSVHIPSSSSAEKSAMTRVVVTEEIQLSGYIVIIKHDSGEGPICEWFTNRCDIGRDPSCDISIKLPTVAPIHCSLELLENGLVRATNHSKSQFVLMIDGMELDGSRILPNGCLITVGERKLKFFYPSLRKSVHFIGNVGDESPDVPVPSGDSPQKPTKALAPMSSPRLIATPDSMPKVQPTMKLSMKTKMVSPARSISRSKSRTPKTPLGTRERYAPVPSRPFATPPTIQVLRHTPNALSPPRPVSSKLTPTAPTIMSSLREAKQVNSPMTQTPKSKSTPVKQLSDRVTSSASPSKRLNTPPAGLSMFPKNAVEQPASPVSQGNSVRSPKKSHVLRTTGFATPSQARPSQGLTNSSVSTSRVHLSSPPVTRKNINEKKTPMSHSQCKVASHSSRSKSSNMSSQLDSVLSPLTNTQHSRFHQNLLNASHATAHAVKLTGLVIITQTAYAKRTGLKRSTESRSSMLNEDNLCAASKHAKGISFGPALSPVQFDKAMPPSTPVKKGAVPTKFKTPKASVYGSRTFTTIDNTDVSTVTSKLVSPSFTATNPGRISGVIFIPPTPDDNLLDSESNRTTTPKTELRIVKIKQDVRQLCRLKATPEEDWDRDDRPGRAIRRRSVNDVLTLLCSLILSCLRTCAIRALAISVCPHPCITFHVTH